jgi:plastocyanin
MRTITLVSALALATVACGGEKKAAEQPAASPAATPAAAPAAPAAAGATHEVYMDFDGKVGKFDPAELTIKSGDVVKFINRTGGPHNIAFWPDSIPAGAAAALDAGMTDRVGPLTGPMMVEPNAGYSVSFAGAPAGVYKLYCLPHLGFKMHAKITVQ